MRIVIIGAGNVGQNLYHGFGQKGIRVELVEARPLMAQIVAHPEVLPKADCYIYTIADHALQTVIDAVDAPRALHLHTSGTMPITVFGANKPHAGVLYWFQSFSKTELIDNWSYIPCFIEGRDIDDIAAIYALAQTLTSRIYEANQHDRERLHVAGVFANNYTNLMYRIAKEILSDTQIPFEALLPLIDRTAEKVHTLSPDEAQTGPAVRGDEAVMAHHLALLGTTEYGAVYQLLAALIAKGRTH